MAFPRLFRSDRGKRSARAQDVLTQVQSAAPMTLDTGAAIQELSQVVKNNPDAVEIYLALGNLYRSQGEIERAVQIRRNLIVRPGLNDRFKGRAWYELGRDYKRGGFVDRAMEAFEQARVLCGDMESITGELARLAAESGDYERAARDYGRLEDQLAQAHYLVRQARELLDKGENHGQARRMIQRAVKVYPGSPEAWMAMLTEAYREGQWKKIEKLLREAVQKVAPEMSFVLLEALIDAAEKAKIGPEPATVADLVPRNEQSKREVEPAAHELHLCNAVLPVIEEQPPDLLLEFYGALLLIRCQDLRRGRDWLEKTLLLKPDFWAARLELLALDKGEEAVSDGFSDQLDYFVDEARRVKRFFCRSCGLKRESVFFVCPRCQSWHSIAFRVGLHD